MAENGSIVADGAPEPNTSFAPESVAEIKVPDGNLNSDIHASAEYRAHLVTVMAKRAVAAAS